jgi:DNA-binding transcriptional LysR family regulator
MELRHLRYFLAVADTLNFSRAAERLRVAQPALSRQIQDLESELGFKLFERSTTHVRLSEAGRALHQQVGKVLIQLDIVLTSAQRIAKGTTGQLRIGTAWNFGGLSAFINDAAREFHEVHPEVSIDFLELPPHEQIQAVRDEKIDVGCVGRYLLSPRKDIDSRLIFSGAMMAVLPKTHRFADRAEVCLRDLKEERWIALADELVPGFKTLMMQVVRPAHMTPKFGRTAHSQQAMLGFVGTGEGICLIPEFALPPESPGLRYVATDCPPLEMCAIWQKGRAAGHVAAYIDILQRKIEAAKPTSPAQIQPPESIKAEVRRNRANEFGAAPFRRGAA